MIQQGRITGHYNNLYTDSHRGLATSIQYREHAHGIGYLVCDNPSDKIDLRLKATQKDLKGLRNYIELRADAKRT